MQWGRTPEGEGYGGKKGLRYFMDTCKFPTVNVINMYDKGVLIKN